jgi:hypothetical protein
MRAVRTLRGGLEATGDGPWMPGLAHAAAALSTVLVFGLRGCLTGLLFATLANFVVFLPLTALVLNGGRPMAPTAVVPAPGRRAQWLLLGFWTATAWAGAALGS